MLALLIIHRNQQVAIPKIRQKERNRYLLFNHTTVAYPEYFEGKRALEKMGQELKIEMAITP